MSLISEEVVKTAMSEALPSILNELKQAMTTQIENQARQHRADIVNAAVRKWTLEEVVPEVIRALTENKDGIIAVAVPSGELLASTLS